MHTSYTVGITTGEYKALQTVMVNPQEWIQTSITNRAHLATVDIQNQYISYKIERG